jgi:hypothetical protein
MNFVYLRIEYPPNIQAYFSQLLKAEIDLMKAKTKQTQDPSALRRSKRTKKK